jgi:hypothetical protein
MAMDPVSRFARSLMLMRASFGVLAADVELLVLPLISGIACLALGAAFMWPLFTSEALKHVSEQADPVMPGWFWGWLFVFYFVQYFIVIFFNTALVGAATARLAGSDPTLSSALSLAVARLGPILGYALISATIGVALRWIGERFGFVGRIVESTLGVLWTVATFLVVPILAAEGVGPVKAIERSTEMLRDTWGENIIGNAGIGVVTSALGVIVMVGGIGGGMLAVDRGNVDAGFLMIGFSSIVLVALFLVSATLSGIYQAAVYYYTLTGRPPRGFDEGLVRSAFAAKDA